MSLTVFANFRIDSEERFLRMQDSFTSFNKASIEKWVVNIRGPLRNEAMSYLRDRLAGDIIEYEIESGKGWFHDSKEMLESITSKYVFFWIEDHICTCAPEDIDNIVKDMQSFNIEYLQYSWFGDGALVSSFDYINKIESNNIYWFDYGRKENDLRQKRNKELTGRNIYIISACGIFSRNLFTRILSKRDPLFRRWPKETPFDFEKRWDDLHWLPIKMGVPKNELFSSIDDDLQYKGSSLIARGLYPKRIDRTELLSLREKGASLGETGAVSFIKKILKKIVLNTPILRKLYSVLRKIPYQI